MNALQLTGGRNEIKTGLKPKYVHLTDNDMTFAEGKEDEGVGRLQPRLGKKKAGIFRGAWEF